MSAVYLIRHGQAGPRTNYDTLSELGREQARRLGQTLVEHQVEFTAAVCGELTRQRETAAVVTEAYRAAGVACPEVAIDARWNEFDLDAVYRDIAPQLAAADPQFHADYEEMLGQMADESHPVHRQWGRCDLPVLRAWVMGRFPVETESWDAFQERIAGALAGLERFGASERVAVFTSGTPIGIVCGAVLGVDTRTRIRLTGAFHNSAYATLHRRDGEWSLFSFNNIPHLPEPGLRSFR